MFKFLHAADIHLDSPQRGLDRYEGAPVDGVPAGDPAGAGEPRPAGGRGEGRVRPDRRRPLRRRLARLQHGPLLRRADGPAPRGGHPGLPDPRQPRRREPDDPRPAAAGQRQVLVDRPAADDHARRLRRRDPRPELRHPRGDREPGARRTPARVPGLLQHRDAPHLRRRPRGARALRPVLASTTCGSASTATGRSATSTRARSSTTSTP